MLPFASFYNGHLLPSSSKSTAKSRAGAAKKAPPNGLDPALLMAADMYRRKMFKKKYSDIPWKEMAGTRDRLIHNYFGVNIDIVWGIIDNELEPVYKGIKSITEKE